MLRMGLCKTLCSSKPWMWNLATAPAWSKCNTYKPYGGILDFCIHSVIPQEVMRENLIRTKLILYKIFFRISIPLSSKTSRIFFNLRWKNCEKTFVGEHDHFEGKGVSGDKNQYNLFCGKWGFENFSFNNFFEKNNIFLNNHKKKILGEGHDHFSGNGELNDKNEYNRFYGKWGTEYSFEVFSQKSPYQLNKSQKTGFWGHIFFCISGPIVPIV